MPNQDYLRRLSSETKCSPASSVERGGASPSDFNPQHTHLGARALAALAQDESESSSEEGDEPTGDTPCAMSAPLFTARDPPPPIGHGEMTGTLQNLRHTKALGLSLDGGPAVSVPNRFKSAASGSSGRRPPSNNIARAKHAGRATMNGVASSRSNDASLSAKRITFAGPAHNVGLNRHSFNNSLTIITDKSKNPHIKGAPESVRNDRQNRGITPTNRNGLVDLTMDSSDEDEAQLTKKPSKKQKSQSLSRSHDYEIDNDYGEDHVSIHQTENKKKSNHETLKTDDNLLATTDKFIEPIPNEFGAREPMPASANNESIRQTVNLAIKQDTSKAPSQTVGLKMSSAATKIEAAVEGRNCAKCMHELETGLNVHRGHDVICPRSRHCVRVSPSAAAAPLPGSASAAEPAGASEELAPVNKSAPTLLCSLSGSLFSTTRGGNRYHIIRGFWEYENSNQIGVERKSFQALGSNRFELCRQISSDIETPPLTEGGIFNGSFAYGWAQKGEPEESFVIHESDVNISFLKQDEESFALTGTGRNMVGKFRLFGTVWKRVTGVSFSLQCRKEYSKLFESLSSPDDIEREESTTWLLTNRDDNEHKHKSVVDRKKVMLSTTKQLSKSVGSGECRIKTQDTDETSISMISTSLHDSNASHMFDEVDLSDDDAAEENEEIDTSTSFSTLVVTSHIKKLQEKAGSVVPVLSSSEKYTASDAFNKIGAPAAQKSCQEIGDFESMHPMGTEHTVEKSQSNDARVACYDMEGITPNEDQVRRVQSDPQQQVLLETILGSHWASILNSHCGLKTASELYNANGEELINRLIGVVGADFPCRQEKDVEVLTEGLLYGWYIQVKEALHVDASISEKTPPTYQRKAEGDSILSTPAGSCLAFLTPLSYVDLLFIKSQRIKSDVELSGTDPSLLAHRYSVYLSKEISLTDAFEVVTKWRQGARLALGVISNDICDSLPQITRLEKRSSHKEIMHTVPSLSMTVPDKENGGLPRRTIFTLDTINNVLYKFVITVGESTCSAAAGKGAFLTFQGAQVLKASRKWKERGNTPLSKTRKPLEASFSNSCGASVSLKGTNLHGDEHRYGQEHDDSVGFYQEFTLDDFVDTHDNITFSSNHEGCALIELESRYAPLILADRKTDLVFSVKDFLFSHEPSSWRFDVTEKLHGQPQVVDFTDDTFGAPHDIAKSHMSMYVNEVGHNMDLVENVESLSKTPGSVTYYIHINKPLVKGETVELLTDYKEQYESMRERKGYGKSNLLDGAKSDSDEISRVRRNLDERNLLEESILTFSEDDIIQVIDFIKGRVWCGVEAATSALKADCKEDHSNLLRQCIARRRIEWVCRRLRIRFLDLIGNQGMTSEDAIFKEGMYIFVHDWPQNDPRPAYTGLATIMSITKDKHSRDVFDVSTPDKKYIDAVPEAVVTHPTDNDFKGVPTRVYSNWKKWKKQQELPRVRLRTLTGLDTFKWNPFFVTSENLSSSLGTSSGIHAKVVNSLKWEFAEEMLFLLAKDKRLNHPFDEMIWCPLSVSFLAKCVYHVAEFLLVGRDKHKLCEIIMGMACDAAKSLKLIIKNSANTPSNTDNGNKNKLICVENLAFNHKVNIRVVVVESIHINKLCVAEYLSNPMPLDVNWYLINQIILPLHAVASLIDWDGNYSLEKLFEQIELDTGTSYIEFFRRKVFGWHPLIE